MNLDHKPTPESDIKVAPQACVDVFRPGDWPLGLQGSDVCMHAIHKLHEGIYDGQNSVKKLGPTTVKRRSVDNSQTLECEPKDADQLHRHASVHALCMHTYGQHEAHQNTSLGVFKFQLTFHVTCQQARVNVRTDCSTSWSLH